MPLILTREEKPKRPMARAVFDPDVYPGKGEVRGDRISVNPGVTDGEDLRMACVHAMEGALCQGFETIWFSARDNLVTPEALAEAVKAAAPAFMENGWLTVYLHCPEPSAAPEEEAGEEPRFFPGNLRQRVRRLIRRLRLFEEPESELPIPAPGKEGDPEERFCSRLEEGFAPVLSRMLRETGLTDGEICCRANVDRRTLARLREERDFCPAKPTAAAFALALELSEEETRDLLARAGYALSRSLLFDVILEDSLEKKNYDVYAVNETLFRLRQPLLGQED